MASTAQLVLDLEEANRRLRALLDPLAPAGGESAADYVVTPECVAGLLSEVMRFQIVQREVATENDPGIDREIRRYQSQLEQLRVRLPAIHAVLLEERTRLETEQQRIQSTSGWVHASRQTL